MKQTIVKINILHTTIKRLCTKQGKWSMLTGNCWKWLSFIHLPLENEVLVKRLFSIKKITPMIVYTINQMHVSYSQIHQPLCCGVRTTSLIKKRVVAGNTVMQRLAYSMTWEGKKLALCQSVLSEATLPLIYQHLKCKLFWILWKTLHNSGLTCYVDNKTSLHHFALFSNSAEGLQDLLSAYNHVSKEISLQINTSKTEAMSIAIQVDFQVNNVKLPRVDNFTYSGGYVSRDCMMNEEIHTRIQSASCAFGRLRKRVFDHWELIVKTKVKVYDQCIIPLLVYGSKTWPLYQKHVKQLRTIQQHHLRSILSIKWDHFVSNEELLERANVLDIEINLLKNHLRWMGHICRLWTIPDQWKHCYLASWKVQEKWFVHFYDTRTRAKWLCSIVKF